MCLTFLALIFCYMRRPRGIEEACPPPPCTHTALANICLGHLCDDLPGPIKHGERRALVIEWLRDRSSKHNQERLQERGERLTGLDRETAQVMAEQLQGSEDLS